MSFEALPLEMIWQLFAYLSFIDMYHLLLSGVIDPVMIGQYLLHNPQALERLTLDPLLRCIALINVRRLGKKQMSYS